MFKSFRGYVIGCDLIHGKNVFKVKVTSEGPYLNQKFAVASIEAGYGMKTGDEVVFFLNMFLDMRQQSAGEWRLEAIDVSKCKMPKCDHPGCNGQAELIVEFLQKNSGSSELARCCLMHLQPVIAFHCTNVEIKEVRVINIHRGDQKFRPWPLIEDIAKV